MKRFYITTPLYYVNDTPHVGHAYCTVNADILTRYHKLFGEETLFLTGTDEHGQKCQDAAVKNNIDPQKYCDQMVVNFRNIWKELDIDFDIFFRTTDEVHKKAVQASLQQLFDKGEIYSDEYEGWYSVSEEIFYTEKDLVNGLSPTGRPVQKIKEKNYFFKMSKYQTQLIEHIEKNPSFIQPESKKNEVLGFLRQTLTDLCISRPKARLSWGIDLPFDKDYVTYVWFDALLNYAVGVGFQQPAKKNDYEKWWNETGPIHLIGKDILTTHTVYWPTMLMALGAKLPKQVFATGWLLTKDNQKMSKSFGEVVKPLDVKDIVGVDAFRYFLARDIQLGNDAQFSVELVVARVNSELANNLGNLLSRSSNLIQKYFDGKMPKTNYQGADTQELKKVAEATGAKVQADIEAMSTPKAIGHVVDLLNHANRYLEQQAPWKSAKENVDSAAEPLAASIETLRIAAILLYPTMPRKMDTLLKQIGWTKTPHIDDAKKWGLTAPGTLIGKAEPLFPRVEEKKDSPEKK
jgi:methionyl-tRNA synthetase